MNAWAKRGLQAAFFTGGMLVLGAGIASATECCPDRPTPPLAPAVSVPVHLCDNVVGLPGGPYALPCVEETLSTDELTATTPVGLPAVDDRGNHGHVNLVVPVVVNGNAIAVTEDAAATGDHEFRLDHHRPEYPTGESGPFAGNVVAADAVVPFVATGNAAGVLANAYSDANSSTDVYSGGDVHTDGVGGPFSGNVLAPYLATPFQASGNGLGVGGSGEAAGDHELFSGAGGDLGTTGQDSSFSGNTVAPGVAQPFQLNGNGAALFGDGHSSSDVFSEARAGGDVVTNGDPAAAAGNIVAANQAGPAGIAGGAPAGFGTAIATGTGTTTTAAGGNYGTTGGNGLAAGNIVAASSALPTQGLGNATAAAGEATSEYADETTATAGGRHSTDGRGGAVSGGIVSVPFAGPVQLAGNATAGGGDATTDTVTTSRTRAGGGNATSGDDSTAGGLVADTPVSLPALAYGNGLSSVGRASARHANIVEAVTGGETYTRGDDSTLGGTAASAPVAGPAEFFGNAATAGGDTLADGRNAATTTAGGFQGTGGDDSVAGGNLAQAPVAVPFQLMGTAAGAAGTAGGTASNTRTARAGGPLTTDDDAGFLASNVVHTPVSGPLEGFGNAAGAVGDFWSAVDSRSDVTAGGPATAYGTRGAGSGNVVATPLAAPSQVFGAAAAAAGEGRSSTSNLTGSTAGGALRSDGSDAFASGNVVNGALAAATQGHVDTVSGLGTADSAGINETGATAGGPVTTSGFDGVLGGNVVDVPAVGAPQPFGSAVSGAGVARSASVSDTELTSGGDVATAGGDGPLSGYVASAPAGALAQAFAVAVAAVGADATARADNVTAGTAGGSTTTDALDLRVPAGIVAQPHDAPIELLGDATTQAANDTTLVTGERDPLVELPPVERAPVASPFDGWFSGGAADRAPWSYDLHHAVAPIPAGDLADAATLPALDGSGLPAVGTLPAIPAMPEVALPELPVPEAAQPFATAQPAWAGRTAAPAAYRTHVADPAASPADAPDAVTLPAFDGDHPLADRLPGADGVEAVPGLDGLPVRNGLSGRSAAPGVDGLLIANGLSGVPVPDGVPSLDGLLGVDGLAGVDGLSGVSGLPLVGSLTEGGNQIGAVRPGPGDLPALGAPADGDVLRGLAGELAGLVDLPRPMPI